MIDLNPSSLQQVKSILQEFVPEYEVRVFGSRVRGNAKKYSDLDLVILTQSPIPLQTMGQMKDAFSESDLPFQVDLVDWSLVSDELRKLIEEKNRPLA